MSSTHAVLLELSERQLELAVAGRWDDLAVVIERFNRQAETLPAADAASGVLLEHMTRLHAQVRARLLVARADTARELGGLRRGRGAMRGYGGAADAPGSLLDGAA